MISTNVRMLIEHHIPSSAGLQALVLLHRSAQSYWTPAAVATALKTTMEGVAQALVMMEAAGLLERASATLAFRYNPSDAGLQAAADQLAADYESNRHAILDAVRAVTRAAVAPPPDDESARRKA